MNIRLARTAKRWSQETLAQEAGVGRSYLGAVERGERNAGAIALFRIARALDVPPANLWKDL